MSKEGMFEALERAIQKCKKAATSGKTDAYAEASGNALAVMEHVLSQLREV